MLYEVSDEQVSLNPDARALHVRASVLQETLVNRALVFHLAFPWVARAGLYRMSRAQKQFNLCDKGVLDLPINTRSILFDHRELRKGVSPFSSHSAEEKEKECKQKV